MSYKPICKPNQLIIGEGEHIAIVTGWTPKDKVAKMLDKKDYAVIGNLYNADRGISFLIRNLIANPQVRYVIGVNATKQDMNAGSMSALREYFEFDYLGFAPEDIPEDLLINLISSVSYQECSNLNELVSLAQKVKDIASKLPAWNIPMCYPEPKREDSNLAPASAYGHKIEGKTIADAWVKILHRIRKNGTIRPTGYDGQWQELIALEVVVTDEPWDFSIPDYLPCDRSSIGAYIPQILDDAPYQDGVKYTYGQRLRSWFGKDQIQQVIDKLIKEPDSASAVMNLWDSGTGSGDGSMFTRVGRRIGDSDHDHSGSPCLNHIWVRIVPTDRGIENQAGELILIATFRSNDMFSAWPFNAFGLRALQKHIRDQVSNEISLDLSMGPLITISDSAHIYDDCFGSVDELIDNKYSKTVRRSRKYDDPVGNFIITMDGDRYDDPIVVEQTSPTGESIKLYRENNALKLAREIVAENPTIQPEHATYLGIELQKAETALNEGWEYEQDR